jgi:hypothetical protein
VGILPQAGNGSEVGLCGKLDLDLVPLDQAHVRGDHEIGLYIDVGAVVPRMGNHLLDSQSPELKDSLPFTSTFIYGAGEGELLFWEPMITLEFLQKTTSACREIRQPKAFRQAGYYPTQYCVRQDEERGRSVTLDGFRYSDGA